MDSYSQFALVYDSLMNDVDYKARSAYLLKLFKKFHKKPSLLLDLACGTGGFSNEMALKGIEVIGVDMSEEMLSAARENSACLGTNVLYLCQKAQELDLYGTVDGAICCMDSLNHITNIKDLKKAFKKVSLFLERDCLFIFDLNTEYKHRHILGDNTFVIEQEDIYCVWQNEYDVKNSTTEITLDFFVEAEDGAYNRYSENFCERAYSKEQISEILSESGFTTVAVYGDMTEKEPQETSDRVVYIVRKQG